jgi:hypothetical protein
VPLWRVRLSRSPGGADAVHVKGQPPNQDQLAAVIALTALELREYRGCFIRSEVFDEAGVDQWLDQVDGAVYAVEQVMNHVHLYDEVSDDDVRLPEMEAVGRKLAQAWRDLLEVRIPARRFTVTFATEPDEYGPTVSVHQAEGCPTCSSSAH